MGEVKLKRTLSLPSMIAIAAGGMIAGWMVEIKYWFEVAGGGAVLSFLLCALMVLPLCFIYAELTSMLPYAGGEVIWVSNAFGWNCGFVTFWLLLLMYIMAMPTVSMGIASMLPYLLPVTAGQLKILAGVILILWFFLTNFELKLLAKLQNIFFWGTLFVSVVADIIFIFSNQWSLSNINWFPYGAQGCAAGVGLLIMKFIGFDLIPQMSEEASFPKKDLWKAFVGSLGCTVCVYALAVVGVGGIVSMDWIAETDIVDPRVADVVGLHWLGIAIVVMGMLTCITTLSAFWLSASRTLYGAGQQHQMTSKLVKLNKNGQPTLANIVVGLLSLYFMVFAPENWLNYIYTFYGLVAGLLYLLVVLSFLRLRKSQPDWNRPYKAKAGSLMGAIGIIFCLWIIWTNGAAMDQTSWVLFVIFVIAGIFVWSYTKIQQKKNPDAWAPVVLNPDTVSKQEADG